MLFNFVFEGNFPSRSPRRAYIWRGDLTEVFLRHRFGGLIFGGAYSWRSLFSEFYGIFSTHQSGFRCLHSTITSLLEATDHWAFSIDHGNVNAVVFLDFKKAFDTVDHDILLSKMNLYGLQGIALDWFRSYLKAILLSRQ